MPVGAREDSEKQPMTRDEFLFAVREQKIDPESFDLNRRRDESYVLEQREAQWAVYYSERGLESGIRHFPRESEALKYLLTVLRSDF
jgi:hypothetical protein